MDITLSKSKQIQKSIETALSEEEKKLSTKVEISIFNDEDTVPQEIEKGRAALRARVDHVIRLENILMDIRRKVDQRNREGDGNIKISDLVTEQVGLRAREKRLARLASQANEAPDLNIVKSEFRSKKAIYDRSTESYGYGDNTTFTTSVADANMVREIRVMVLSVKNRIEEIQRTLNYENMKLVIQIPDEDISYLQDNLII